MSQYVHIDVQNEGNVSVVTLTDKKLLFYSEVQDTADELLELLGEMTSKRMVLDFTVVESITASFLAKLVTVQKRIRNAKGELKLYGMAPKTYELFVATKLSRVFNIHDTKEKALASFQQA